MSNNLKDQIDPDFINHLAKVICKIYSQFDRVQFSADLLNKNWNSLGLKERVHAVATQLDQQIKGSYKQKISVLKKTAPQIQGMGGMIFPDFVEQFGKSHWEESISALRFFTPYFSSEFAVRPFIELEPKKMMKQMLVWSKDKNEHVRRLACEGCRPRLPWSFKLRAFIQDPSPLLPILENLKEDESLYVRKSVANNLNDLTKDHPELVLKLAKKWMKNKNPHTDWIIKHALRTQFKRGNPHALSLFGMGDAKGVIVKNLQTQKAVFVIGTEMEFSFTLENRDRLKRKLRVDYVIYYFKKRGAYSKKVFKMMEREFEPGKHALVKRHSIRQMTTRIHYPGLHKLEIVVNGDTKATQEFHLAHRLPKF